MPDSELAEEEALFLPEFGSLADEEQDDEDQRRLAAIKSREQRAARQWHTGSAPRSASSGVREFDVGGDCGTVRYREMGWPPHGGEIVATGSIVWDAALVLCRYLQLHLAAGEASPGQPLTAVELGAGLALPTMAFAQICATRGQPFSAVATDVDSRLPLIRSNFQLNETAASCTAAVLPWGDETAAAAVGRHKLVLCSDVLFSPAAIQPLVATVDAVTAPDGVVLTCCEHRFPEAEQFYDALAARGFGVCPVPLSEQDSQYRHPSIHLYRALRDAS